MNRVHFIFEVFFMLTYSILQSDNGQVSEVIFETKRRETGSEVQSQRPFTCLDIYAG
jgi:hypothetical protein